MCIETVFCANGTARTHVRTYESIASMGNRKSLRVATLRARYCRGLDGNGDCHSWGQSMGGLQC